MTQVKRRVSDTLDVDLVSAFETAGENLSVQINMGIRNGPVRDCRHRALGDMLDRLAAERGALDTVEDQEETARFVRLLGGMSDGTGGGDGLTSTVAPGSADGAARRGRRRDGRGRS
ncbi:MULTISPECIES: hypothetical protein [unclassified Frankia]|uniref:hypothetical protein n=1 Tax=unclassified Frankia TaxID=2632575 RepID=UPI0020240E60